MQRIQPSIRLLLLGHPNQVFGKALNHDQPVQLIESFFISSDSVAILNRLIIIAVFLSIFVGCTEIDVAQKMSHLQGEMAGEVTDSSVILQSRITAIGKNVEGDIPGREGVARFNISRSTDFVSFSSSDWITARSPNDFIVKAQIEGLEPATRYYYRLEYGLDSLHTALGPVRTFRTAYGEDLSGPSSFVVVTGMHYGRFYESEAGQSNEAVLGYPALVSIQLLNPDFFVGTGDNVYYDHLPEVTTLAGMRKKWHEQFSLPRFIDLFASVPTYWEKDDHDHRYNDSDTTDTPVAPDRYQPDPGHHLGVRTFREQVPILPPEDIQAGVTYRTHRISRLLQIWLLEGRDYRSPNLLVDGPEKSLWGETQRTWLMETLLESDAPFKVVISPTPLVGPDDAYKIDNHTNAGGFLHEGTAFLNWAKEEGFLERGLYLVCGDRHWQYHAVHPLGFEEFSTGALVDGNARLGRNPGDPESTDPDARIVQHFTSPEASGGFLNVRVQPGEASQPATIGFYFYDEKGTLLYEVVKPAMDS